jgi:putative ABC transport system permease protein
MIKITLRNLLKNKVVSIINVTGLVIGFAACILISLYVYHEKSQNNGDHGNA